MSICVYICMYFDIWMNMCIWLHICVFTCTGMLRYTPTIMHTCTDTHKHEYTHTWTHTDTLCLPWIVYFFLHDSCVCVTQLIYINIILLGWPINNTAILTTIALLFESRRKPRCIWFEGPRRKDEKMNASFVLRCLFCLTHMYKSRCNAHCRQKMKRSLSSRTVSIHTNWGKMGNTQAKSVDVYMCRMQTLTVVTNETLNVVTNRLKQNQ